MKLNCVSITLVGCHFHLLPKYPNIYCVEYFMSELVGKLLLALTRWQAVNFSSNLVSFSHKVIFQSALSLLRVKLKNLPLWSTCHMAQYNRGEKIGDGIWRIFSGQNWKREVTGLNSAQRTFKKKVSAVRGNCQIWSEIITNWTFYQGRVNVKLICRK